MQKIQANIARILRATMNRRQKTLAEFSEEFGIPVTSMKKYLRGCSNPRADTIALLADGLGVTPAELVSGLPDSVIQAELVLQAAKEIGELVPTQREEGVQLFLALVEIFSAQSKTEHPEECSAAEK